MLSSLHDIVEESLQIDYISKANGIVSHEK